MVSGLDDVSSVETALGVGAYGYLTKPFKNNDIIIAVSNALHRRGLERENQLEPDLDDQERQRHLSRHGVRPQG